MLTEIQIAYVLLNLRDYLFIITKLPAAVAPDSRKQLEPRHTTALCII